MLVPKLPDSRLIYGGKTFLEFTGMLTFVSVIFSQEFSYYIPGRNILTKYKI